MRGIVTLFAIYGLVLVLLLSGCTNGRWVVHDLSNISFEFTGPTPARDPMPISTADRPPMSVGEPIHSLAAAHR